MIIIGITGTLGAGKGTIVDYLVKQKGFVHYSVRARKIILKWTENFFAIALEREGHRLNANIVAAN